MNRIQLDPGILDPDPDDLAPARGCCLGVALGALSWGLAFIAAFALLGGHR